MAPALPLNAWLRWDLISTRLSRIAPPSRVLELGTGLGGVGARLAKIGSYTGVEPDPTSRRVAASRLPAGSRLVGHLEALDAQETFDLVCAFEVLEHIQDDASAISTWAARVAPGGHLVISVPAHQRRFGAWDARVGHLRRYEREQLDGLLVSAALEPVAIDGSGFPLGNLLERSRNAIARLERRRADSISERTAASGRTFQPPNWSGGFTQAASYPFRLAQRPFRRTRLGTGWVAIARRPGS